jgi:hypothetical protein
MIDPSWARVIFFGVAAFLALLTVHTAIVDRDNPSPRVFMNAIMFGFLVALGFVQF